MKFLVDENVSLIVCHELRKRGHDVISIAESFSGYTDIQVYELAISEKRIIITRDFHFSNPIKFPASLTKGVVYIRHGNLKSEEELGLICRLIDSKYLDRIDSKFAVIHSDKIILR